MSLAEWRIGLGWLARLLVSGGLLWFILARISFGSVVEVLLRVQWFPLAVGIGFILLTTYAAAIQLKMLTDRQGMTRPLGELVAINLATSFYGLFLPGYLAGGVLRWYKLARSEQRPLEALATLVYNRLLELAAAVGLGLVFWLADPLARSSWLVPVVFALLLLGLVGFQGVVAYPPLTTALVRLLHRTGIPRLAPARVRARARAAFETGTRLGRVSPATLAAPAAVCVARHLLGVLLFMCFARALGLPLTFTNLGWVRSVLLLVGLLPVSLGGLGVREGSLVVLLHPYQVPAADALAFGFLLFARDLLTGAAGGLLEARAFLALRTAD